MKWFGYKLLLIFDATYELPVMFSVTNGSESDINEAHRMLAQMEKKQPAVLETAETMALDKAYDDTKLITALWDRHQIKAVIDIRNIMNLYAPGVTVSNIVQYIPFRLWYCYTQRIKRRRHPIAKGGSNRLLR